MSKRINLKNYITIVIPCKNEVNYIGKLLVSLCYQEGIFGTKIYVADAGSTDGTLKVLERFSRCDWFDLEVISGGLPGDGRNAGAFKAETPYVLFIDADMSLKDRLLIKETLIKMIKNDLDLCTCRLLVDSSDLRSKALYQIINLAQGLSTRVSKPFSTGMFMMVKLKAFISLGGFLAGARFAEDYHLSRRFNREKFGVSKKYALATDRRFKKMGYLKTALLSLKAFLNANDENWFYKDVGYWKYKF